MTDYLRGALLVLLAVLSAPIILSFMVWALVVLAVLEVADP